MAPTRIEIGAEQELLKDGQMKEVAFPTPNSETKILLSRVAGKYYATSNKCTHYGAPLIKGVLTETGRVVCPWHGACYDVCTGDIEDSPGMNSLHSFKVETENNVVYVTAPAEELTTQRVPTAPAVLVATQAKGVIVIGGGGASAHGVEALREQGYKGRIQVFSEENYLPIDRTKLSKGLMADAKKIQLRSQEFYEGLKVEIELGVSVTAVDFENDSVTLSTGVKHDYDQLIVATGSTANRIPVEGSKLDNIFVMRSVVDTAAIDAALGHDPEVKKNVVIIGSSFIGMEAGLATSKRAKVSIVGMEKVPFSAILGEEIGAGIQKYHEAQGTTFYLSASLSKFLPSATNPSAVGAVVLADGTSLPADLVILGVGVKPCTSLFKAAGFELEKDGGIRVDGHLKVEQIKKGNVFAVGDIANYPDKKTGDRVRIEHWNVASNHARSVAKTISGHPDVFDKVPVFWSAQGQQLRYAGSAGAKYWDDVVIHGNADELKFVAYYLRGDEVVAAASMQSDPIVSHVSELFALGKMLSGKEIKAGKPHVFRLHRSRVYYVRESLMRQAISVPRANLISLGVCLGKFSKTEKFRLHVTGLDLLGRYAKNKIWIKPNGEMPFLYGNHVVKAHLGKITEDTPEHQGVVVFSMTDVPLGFGVTARSTVDTRKLDPTSVIVFNQADVGEYLRDEDTLF